MIEKKSASKKTDADFLFFYLTEIEIYDII